MERRSIALRSPTDGKLADSALRESRVTLAEGEGSSKPPKSPTDGSLADGALKGFRVTLTDVWGFVMVTLASEGVL